MIIPIPIHGESQNFLEWALQNATRPEWMPMLEEYKSLIESFLNTSECRAKVNYIGVYYGFTRSYNETIGLFAYYVQLLDLQSFRTIRVYVLDKNTYGRFYPFTDSDLEHGLKISGTPVFFFELDEDMFHTGRLMARRIYVRLNETHLGDLTSYILATSYPDSVENYPVYCPTRLEAPRKTVTETETITETETVTVTTPIVLTITTREILSETRTITVTTTHTQTMQYTIVENTSSLDNLLLALALFTGLIIGCVICLKTKLYSGRKL